MKTVRRTAGALAALVLAAVTVVGAPSAQAHEAVRVSPEPQLSIAIDNGQTSAAAGDDLSYTITVTNLGPDRVRDLVVTQTMPAGLRFESADAGGALHGDAVTWKVEVKTGGKAVVHSAGVVAGAPADTLRLASVACALVNVRRPPVVCATHSDQLPAGAAADAAAASRDAPGTGGDSGRLGWAAGGAVVVVGAGAALFLVRRRRAVYRG
jgi:uncharacterized repeat protein (TIGR01451 family)